MEYLVLLTPAAVVENMLCIVGTILTFYAPVYLVL
jgi:hypothetical protein